MAQSYNFPAPQPIWDKPLHEVSAPVQEDRSDLGLSFEIGVEQLSGVPAWAAGAGSKLLEKAGFEDAARSLLLTAQTINAEMVYDIAKLERLYEGPHSWAEAQEEGTLGSYALWGINELVKQTPQIAISVLAALATGGISAYTQLAGRAALGNMMKKMPFAGGSAIRGSQIGGYYLSSALLNTGEIYSSALLETGENHPGVTAVAGLTAGILDMWPGSKVIRAMGRTDDLGSYVANKFLRDKPFQSRFYRAMELAATQGLVEDMQAVIEGVTVNYLTENNLQEEYTNLAYGIFPMTASQQAERIESRAAGAVVGLPFGFLGRTSPTRYSDKLPPQTSITEDAVNALTSEPITPAYGEGVAPAYDETTTVGYAGVPRRRPGFAARPTPEGAVAPIYQEGGAPPSLAEPAPSVTPLVTSQWRDAQGRVMPPEQVEALGGRVTRPLRRGIEAWTPAQVAKEQKKLERKAVGEEKRAVKKAETKEEREESKRKASIDIKKLLDSDVDLMGATPKEAVSVTYGEKVARNIEDDATTEQAAAVLVDYGRQIGTVEYREDVEAGRELFKEQLAAREKSLTEAEDREVNSDHAVEWVMGVLGKESFESLNNKELIELLKDVNLPSRGRKDEKIARLEEFAGEKLRNAIEKKNTLAQTVSEEQAWLQVLHSLRENRRVLGEVEKAEVVTKEARAAAGAEAQQKREAALLEKAEKAKRALPQRKTVTKRSLRADTKVRTLKKPSTVIQKRIEEAGKALTQFSDNELESLMDSVDLDYVGLSREERIDRINKSMEVSAGVKRKRIVKRPTLWVSAKGEPIFTPTKEKDVQDEEWSPAILAYTGGEAPSAVNTVDDFFGSIEYYTLVANEKYNSLFTLGEKDDHLVGGRKESALKVLRDIFSNETSRAAWIKSGGPDVSPRQIYDLEYYLTNKKVPIPSWMRVGDYTDNEMEVTLRQVRDAINERIADKKAREAYAKEVYEKEQAGAKEKGKVWESLSQKERERRTRNIWKSWNKLAQKDREFRIGKIKKVEIITFDQAGRYVVKETPTDQMVWGVGDVDTFTRNVFRGEPYPTFFPDADLETSQNFDNLSQKEQEEFIGKIFTRPVRAGEGVSLAPRLTLYDHTDTKIDEQSFDDARSVRVHIALRDILDITKKVNELKESGRYTTKEIIDTVENETGIRVQEQDVVNVKSGTKEGIPLSWLMRVANAENINIGVVSTGTKDGRRFVNIDEMSDQITVVDGEVVLQLTEDEFFQDAYSIGENEQYLGDKLETIKKRIEALVKQTPDKPAKKDRTLDNPEYQDILEQALEMSYEESVQDLQIDSGITTSQDRAALEGRLEALVANNRDYLFSGPASSAIPNLTLKEKVKDSGKIYDEIRTKARYRGEIETSGTFISRSSNPPVITKAIAEGTKVTLSSKVHKAEIQKEIAPHVKSWGKLVKELNESGREITTAESAKVQEIIERISRITSDILSREYNVEKKAGKNLSVKEDGRVSSRDVSESEVTVVAYSEKAIERNVVKQANVQLAETNRILKETKFARSRKIIRDINREYIELGAVLDEKNREEAVGALGKSLVSGAAVDVDVKKILKKITNIPPGQRTLSQVSINRAIEKTEGFTSEQSLADLLRSHSELNHQRKQKILTRLYTEGLITKKTYDERTRLINEQLAAKVPSPLAEILDDRQKIQLINELRYRNNKFISLENIPESTIRRVGKSLGVVFHKKAPAEATYKRIQKIFKETSDRLKKAQSETPEVVSTAVSLDYPRIWDEKPWTFVRTNATGEMVGTAATPREEYKGGKWIETAPLVTWKNAYGIVITQMRVTTELDRDPRGRFISEEAKEPVWEYVYEVYDPYNIRNVSSGELVFRTKGEAAKKYERATLYKLGGLEAIPAADFKDAVAERDRVIRSQKIHREISKKRAETRKKDQEALIARQQASLVAQRPSDVVNDIVEENKEDTRNLSYRRYHKEKLPKRAKKGAEVVDINGVTWVRTAGYRVVANTDFGYIEEKGKENVWLWEPRLPSPTSNDIKRSVVLESSFQDSGLLPQYIVAKTDEKGMDVNSLMGRMADAFGNRSLDFIHVVQSQKELPVHLQDSSKRVRAVVFNKDIWFVADNISEDRVVALVLHEIGVHGFQSVMGKRLYQKLMGAVAMLANTDGQIGAVYEKLARENPKANESWLVEETMGYMVESEAVEQNAFWRALIDHILYGVARLKLFLNPKWITPSDLLVFAKSAVKSYREASKVGQYTYIANYLNAPLYSAEDVSTRRSDGENATVASLRDSGQVIGQLNLGFNGSWIDRDMPKPRNFLENFLVVRNITKEPQAEVGGRRIRRIFGSDYQVFAGDNITKWLHNYFNDIHTLEKSIERRGGKITPENMPSLWHGAYKNIVNFQRKVFHNRYVKALSTFMHNNKVDGDDLHNYLYASHAPHANAKISKKSKGEIKSGSGLTDAEAQKILDDLRDRLTPEQWGNLQQAANAIYVINNHRLELLIDNGMIDESELNSWLKNTKEFNATYVPLREKNDTLPDEIFGEALTHAPISVQGLESKYRTGRYSPAGNTWAWSIMQVDYAIDRIEKNKVVKSFARMVMDNESELKNDIVVLDEEHFEGAKNFEEGEVLMEGLYSKMATDPSHHITFKAKGKVFHILTKHKRIGDAFNRNNMTDSGAIMQLFAQINRFFSAIHTTLSPEFIITNFIRDLQTGIINLQSDITEGSARKLKNPDKLAKQVLKDLRVAGVGLKHYIRDDRNDTDWSRAAKIFSESGGRIDFYAFKDARDFEKKFNVYVKDTTPNGARRVRNALIDFMGDYNAVFENTMRLSVFKNARDAFIDNGLTEQQANLKAADIARNLTVNFSNKGEKTQAFNSLYLFFNAGVQGTVRLMQAAVRRAPTYDEEGRVSGRKGFTRVQKTMGSIALFGFANGVMNALFGGEDEEGVNRYRQISLKQRQRNMHIYLPGFDNWIKLPLPYGYNVPYVIGDTFAALIMGHIGPGQASLNTVDSMIESFIPFSWGGSDTAIGTAVKTASPQFIDPFLDLAMNESFFGGPIYKEPSYGSADPPSERYWSNTGGTFKTMSRAINAITGGSKVEAGVVSLEPDILEFFWETYAGSAGRFVERTYDLGVGITFGRITHKETGDINWSKVPIGRRFFYDETATKRGFRYEKYNEYINQIKTSSGVMTGIQKVYGVSSKQYQSFKKSEDFKIARLDGLRKATEGGLTKLYKARAAIQRNRILRDDVKEERIDRLKEKMNLLRDRLIKKVDDVLNET